MIKTMAGALAGVVMLAVQAAAAELPPQFETCAALRRDSERLLCYDKAVAQIRSGTAGTSGPTAENMFGANSDVLGDKAHQPDVKREELRQISGTVTSLHRGDDGMIQLVLDNGQVWRQTDADVRLLVESGDTVTVVRAAMGTFRITDKSGRHARFRRVR